MGFKVYLKEGITQQFPVPKLFQSLPCCFFRDLDELQQNRNNAKQADDCATENAVMSEEYGGLISENITTLPLPVEEPTGDHFLQKMSHSD